MKKIFLTSGIIACMACPAFADPTGFAANAGNASTTTNVANACTMAIIGVDQGATNLRAKWTQTFKEITLSNNAINKGYGNVTGVSPAKLYGVPGDTKVYNAKDGNGNLSGGQGTTGTTLLSQTPVGKSIAFSYNYNLPRDASTGVAYTAPTTTATASVSATRAFQGFFDNADGTGTDSTTNNQYLTSTGILTSKGLTASQSADATWYAQYQTACPTYGVPALNGYTFNGWALTQAGNAESGTTTAGSSICITDGDDSTSASSNRTLYAKWTPKTTTVTYNCGASSASTPVSGTWTNPTGMTSNSKTATFDAAFSHAPGSACTLQGYTFSNWYCVSGTTGSTTTGQIAGNGIVDDSGTDKWHMATYNANVTCTAVWQKQEITLHWSSANGQPATIADGTCQYDGAVTLPVNPTRTGYTFNGWEVYTPSQI